MNDKKNIFIAAGSVVAIAFIAAFFIIQCMFLKNGEGYIPMTPGLQTFFGIGLLIISLCALIFLAASVIRKKVPHFLEVSLLEVFTASLLTGVVALFLLFMQ